MTKVRVNTATLKTMAKNIDLAGRDLYKAKSSLTTKGASARTYEQNSFGPRVRVICQQAARHADDRADVLDALSVQLSTRAKLYDNADNKFLKNLLSKLVLLYTSRTDKELRDVSSLSNLAKKKSSKNTKESTTKSETPNKQKVSKTSSNQAEFTKPTSPVSTFNITGSFGTYFAGTSVHNGVDLGGNKGDSICSITPGEVLQAGWKDDGLGYRVKIKAKGSDGKSYIVTYAHLNTKPLVSAGDIVKAQDKIGEMGMTGNATGLHLHLTINEEGKGSWNFLKQINDPSNIKPSSIVPGDTRTYLEEMQDNWVDPTPIISGETDLTFNIP